MFIAVPEVIISHGVVVFIAMSEVTVFHGVVVFIVMPGYRFSWYGYVHSNG